MADTIETTLAAIDRCTQKLRQARVYVRHAQIEGITPGGGRADACAAEAARLIRAAHEDLGALLGEEAEAT